MQDGKFRMQPSLFSPKSNKRRQILKLFYRKDCTNMMLANFRRVIFLKKSNNPTICAGWNKVQAGNFVTCMMEKGYAGWFFLRN